MVTSRDEILALPLARCTVAASCSACVQLQDPYCGWNIVSSKCVSHNTFNSQYASEFLQNVTVGRHRQCGDSESSVIIEEFKDGREDFVHPSSHPSGEKREVIKWLSFNFHNNIKLKVRPSVRVEKPDTGGRYSTEELSMAVATSCVSALLLGFIAGFLLARRCQCGSDNPYHVPYLNRLGSNLWVFCKTFLFRSGYEEENIYAKVDDMTYYPVVGPIQTMASPGDQVSTHVYLHSFLKVCNYFCAPIFSQEQIVFEEYWPIFY